MTVDTFGHLLGRPESSRCAAAFAAPGTVLEGEVRGKRLPVTVAPMPFHPTTYKR